MTGKGAKKGRKAVPAGRAIGWWVAGFEERIYPERETVEERVRWGTETRVVSGEDGEVVVRFPEDAAHPSPAEHDGPARPAPAAESALAGPESTRSH